ncbi:hypothetical protein BOW53_12540 [Solemya pervernicosa gill symbiont]|uniref:Uncharacterized protein n=1 Tax=Solemya pervernicosa gill symbiont TaxID=642797 RepID=A0A1T2L281_9GAMM|nr:hypothetical protein BOW53_12540 [Solemya pervernicosa gill symbiont]
MAVWKKSNGRLYPIETNFSAIELAPPINHFYTMVITLLQLIGPLPIATLYSRYASNRDADK